MNLTNPHVTCVCLTADRQAYTDRALKCFLAQTYPNKSLLILDNGRRSYLCGSMPPEPWVKIMRVGSGSTIGELRNFANAQTETNIIAHWDSDDWSGPTRLEDQVEKLMMHRSGLSEPNKLGIEAVGYHTMLFWNSQTEKAYIYENTLRGYCIGTSLMYWRSVWAQDNFAATSSGEDDRWLKQHRCYSLAAFEEKPDAEPLMVAEFHGKNTALRDPESFLADPTQQQYRRAPEWDDRLKELMTL
jgi:hypothetical protein